MGTVDRQGCRSASELPSLALPHAQQLAIFFLFFFFPCNTMFHVIFLVGWHPAQQKQAYCTSTRAVAMALWES